MKQCTKCGLIKGTGDFTKHYQTTTSECRECKKKADAIYRASHRVRMMRRLNDREYKRKNVKRICAYLKEFKARFPEKEAARRKLRYEVKMGRIKVGTNCHDCGKAGGKVGVKIRVRELVADHYLGYEKQNWLNVQWICRVCDAAREQVRRRERISA